MLTVGKERQLAMFDFWVDSASLDQSDTDCTESEHEDDRTLDSAPIEG